jgi:hypothetical protein
MPYEPVIKFTHDDKEQLYFQPRLGPLTLA